MRDHHDRVFEAEVVDEEEFDPNPLLSQEEWRIVCRAMLAYPETPYKLRRVAYHFLETHRIE